MTNHEDNPLLVAVKKLSAPREVTFAQRVRGGERRMNRVQQPALLRLLREAVPAGIGAHEGGGADGARLPFDTGAMKLYDEIEHAVSVWFVDLVDEPIHMLPETNLAKWFLLYENQRRAGLVTPKDDHSVTALVCRWVHDIEVMFDPPKRVPLFVSRREVAGKVKTRRITDDRGRPISTPVLDENSQPVFVPKRDANGQPVTRVVEHLPATCPNCSCQFAFDPATGDKSFALVLEFRDEGADTERNATAFCRACTDVWSGAAQMKELSEAIEAEEQAINGGVS